MLRIYKDDHKLRIALVLQMATLSASVTLAQSTTFDGQNVGNGNITVVASTNTYSIQHREHHLADYARGVLSGMAEVDKEDLNNFETGEKGMVPKSARDGVERDGVLVQNTPQYDFVRYIPKGQWVCLLLPTVKYNSGTKHYRYQRLYNYDNEYEIIPLTNLRVWGVADNPTNPYPPRYNLDVKNSTTQVGLNVLRFSNGYVTGWDVFGNSEVQNHITQSMLYRLDADSATLAIDFSNYDSSVSGLVSNYNQYRGILGNLTEPSLSHRVVWHVKDASIIATALNNCIGGGSDADRALNGTFLEDHTIHFPHVTAGIAVEHIPMKYELNNYYFYNQGALTSLGALKGTNQHLANTAVVPNNTRLKIILYDKGNTGIALSRQLETGTRDANNYGQIPGLYLSTELGFGGSRFIQFAYSSQCDNTSFSNLQNEALRRVQNTGPNNPAYIMVVAVADDGTEYNVARFKLIFDDNSETLSWKDVLHKGAYGYNRTAKRLKELHGNNIARITFDYPKAAEVELTIGEATSYEVTTTMDKVDRSSKLPLNMLNSSYAHWYTVPDELPLDQWHHQSATAQRGTEPSWGEYGIFNHMKMFNRLYPVRGINYKPDQYATPVGTDSINYVDPSLVFHSQHESFTEGFLYVDAAERPADVASCIFEGNFCVGDRLMVTGWMCSPQLSPSSAAKQSPGSLLLTVKGRRYDYDKHENVTEEIYTFCPGQIVAEMRRKLNPANNTDFFPNAESGSVGNNGVDIPIHYAGTATGINNINNNNGYDIGRWAYGNLGNGNPQESAPWQQFYFEFNVEKKYDQCWLEVKNNAYATQGGDYMLDNILVFSDVPRVIVQNTTPVCVVKDENGDAAYETRLLKMRTDFDEELTVKGIKEATASSDDSKYYMSFAVIEEAKFLERFLELVKQHSGFEDYTVNDIKQGLQDGRFDLTDFDDDYAAAFDYAQPGEAADHTKVWDSWTHTDNAGASLMRYEWSSFFADDAIQPVYNFQEAADPELRKPVYRQIDGTHRYIVFNGNMVDNVMKPYVKYYVIPYNGKLTSADYRFSDFNLRSQCNIKYDFQIMPPIQVLGLQETDNYGNVEACENQIPTIQTQLQGYDSNGNEVNMKGLHYDWWTGRQPKTLGDDDPGVKATIENFYAQSFTADGETFLLKDVLNAFRANYIDATTLDGVVPQEAKTVDGKEYGAFTQEMIDYLKSLVDRKELLLCLSTLNQPIHAWSDDEPYCYLVACPIHDETFKRELGGENADSFEYFCDEPQGIRIEVHNAAPTLNTGFEGGSGGIEEYNYPDNVGTLSIRLARMSQFQKVQHGNPDNAPDSSLPTLFLPVREAQAAVSDATGVHNGEGHTLVVSTPDIYLADTNDPYWAQKIQQEMEKEDQDGKPVGILPIVGKIVSLNAEDTRKGRSTEDAAAQNHMRIHFTDNFDVRDGYNYVLKIPFEDKLPDGTLSNACHGDMLFNLKIVPDYEVWMGTEDNHDWNNDANWRRADWDDLLLKADGKAPNVEQEYLTNTDNGNRNGFAPLYCTHLLIMTPDGTTERGSYSPELYDMFGNGRTLSDGTKVSGVSALDNSPFPNLNPATATDILKYDFQAIPYDKDVHTVEHTHGASADDLIAEMYDINRCQDIVFQTHTELLNAHLLSYDKAWVEFALGKNRWHIVGSPLQDVISGEWYAPYWSTRQESTYFEPIQFGDSISGGGLYKNGSSEWERYYLHYDRFAPTVYQRAWDKAKAVLYEKASNWRTDDGSQTDNLGSTDAGVWNNERTEWLSNSDEYLERIAYKPMGNGKANVAIKGTWSGTYNDAAVRYNDGGFSIMPMNIEKTDRDGKTGLSLFRLPKEDAWYDTYDWGSPGGKRPKNTGSRVYIEDNFNLERPVTYPQGGYAEKKSADNTIQLNNRGLLRTNLLAGISEAEDITKGKILASLSNDKEYTVTLSNEGNGSTGIFLASNPFICGLDMQKFLAANADNVEPYYLVLNDNEIQGDASLTEGHARNWSWHEVDVQGAIDDDQFHGEQIVKPRYAFFLHAKEGKDLNTLTIRYTTDMMARSYGQTEEDTPAEPNPAKPCMTIRAQRGGNSSTATVSISPDYSNQFSIGEDMVTLIDEQLAADIPVVYTVTGRLATSVNRLNSFTCLPLGVESNSEEYCTLTFTGVDNLSTLNSHLYDAYLETLTPISEGMQVRVPGQTQNRFFIVCGTPSVGVAESNIQIYDEGGMVHVLSTTTAPLTSVRAYDTAGRLVYSVAPNKTEYSFRLPKGVYIIEGLTARDRKTLKQSIY